MKNDKQCCLPFLNGEAFPDTAEGLMRSRYTAYTLGNIEYIKETLAPESRGDFDYRATENWSKSAEWMGLKILGTKGGLASDTTGEVEFIASFEQGGKPQQHHELATFRKDERGHWLFVDGQLPGRHTFVREEPKIGRNDPCSCGSGKKFKRCCGAEAGG